MKKQGILTAGLTAFMLITVVTAAFAVPEKINYQGILTDDSGASLHGDYDMEFRICDSETLGTCDWLETHSGPNSITVTNGIYNVQLGALTPFATVPSLFDTTPLFLEMRVFNPGTSSWETLEPRQRITSSAFAMKAGDADLLDGLDSTDFAADSHSHSGSAITSGIVDEAFIDPAVARDSEIMPAVLANDGSDTGLDADKLDGMEAVDFSPVSHNHATLYYTKNQSNNRYVNTAGDTMTGTLDLPSGIALSVNGDEAIWYNGAYFSWGFGGTANYFQDAVGIGTAYPNEKLTVAGTIESTSGGIKFPDGTVQTTASAPTWHQILPAAERFQLVMGGDAVLDRETGLVWEQSPSTISRNYYNSYLLCFNTEVGGRKGWHLPTAEQLASLVDSTQIDPPLPVGHPFSNIQNGKYWTSSSGYLGGYKMIVHMGGLGSGGVETYPESTTSPTYKWCVRGGQSQDDK